MSKQRYGCSSVVNAVCLQFELAGHELFTDIKRDLETNQWWCEFAVRHPNGRPVLKPLCDCNQGRLPCTCKRVVQDTVTTGLHDAQTPPVAAVGWGA